MNIYPETTGSKSYPILVLGADWPTDPVQKQNFTDSLSRQNISKINIGLQELLSPDFKVGDLDSLSLLLINLQKSDLEAFSQKIDFNLLTTPVVVRLSYPDLDVLEWINHRGISHFVSEETPETLERVLELSNLKIQKKQVVRQIADQSKSVDQVVQEQEEKIIAKTLDIELSNQEQNQKLKRERQLLKFLKDIALSDFYESFLRSIKSEFKVFHELGEIFLVDVKSNHEISVLNLKTSDRWRDLKASSSPSDFLSSKSMSAFFANFFQRPFGKVVSLNLKANYYLIVESHLNDAQNIPFLEFFNDRQDILKMVFDKIDNEEKMNSISFRWEKTFDFIKDPIAIIDEDYSVVAYNSAFQNIPERRKCYEVFAGRTLPCTGCPLETNKKSQNLQSGSVNIGNHSFDVMAFDLGGAGKKRSFVHTYKDQTEGIRLQLELIQKKKMATIGKLAGHLSHELNNPLTGIRSMAQILLKETKSESQAHKDLTEIESAAQRSLLVIKNFIEFSDDKNHRIENTDIHQLIERTIPLMKTSLRNHSVIKNLFAKKYTARVNAPLFQQVLFNLMKNAIQALTEKGRVQIETGNPTETSLRISIVDSGKGIPKEFQSLIFQPFFTTKDKTQGNGLGLSIVKTIVESFQGRIYFTSEEGVGTQFHIELPVASRNENTSH